jgi:phosphoglycolate phosphatase
LAHRFGSLHTADDGPGKPHPAMLNAAMAEAGAEPSGTVMIGDTTFDMLMARAAGVAGLGVSWGYHGTPELEAAGALFVASDFAELVRRLTLASEPG